MIRNSLKFVRYFCSMKQINKSKITTFDDDKNLSSVLSGNIKYSTKMIMKDQDYFKKLSEGQKPTYLWIGCADSRVPANEITGLEAGEIFVHRNIANMVVGQDLNLLSVVQYAVEVLKVPNIIVCGHYGCGGVKAAMQKQDLGLIENWLRGIRDVYRLNMEELDSIPHEEERCNRLVELNVKEQVLNLYKLSSIQKVRKDNYNKKSSLPNIYGLIYDISTGKLKKLDIDFETEKSKHQHIYDLY